MQSTGLALVFGVFRDFSTYSATDFSVSTVHSQRCAYLPFFFTWGASHTMAPYAPWRWRNWSTHSRQLRAPIGGVDPPDVFPFSTVSLGQGILRNAGVGRVGETALLVCSWTLGNRRGSAGRLLHPEHAHLPLHCFSARIKDSREHNHSSWMSHVEDTLRRTPVFHSETISVVEVSWMAT